MTEGQLGKRLAEIKTSLLEVEQSLAEGETPRRGLEDFKMAVDHIRLSIWAILTAAQSEDYPGVVARFRLGRAVEICQHVIADIDAGVITPGFPELERFRGAIEETQERIARLMEAGK